MSKTILVFGANGNLGQHFVEKALDSGYSIRAFVRNPGGFRFSGHPKVKVMGGDSTNSRDVYKALNKDVDLVVSCLGNPDKDVQIMEKSYENILKAAAIQEQTPRCLMISGVGLRKKSPISRLKLHLASGKASVKDFERADEFVLQNNRVPSVVIRSSRLTDHSGSGRFEVLEKLKSSPKEIAREDVANFFINCVNNTMYDGKVVMIQGK